jgi:hypothetical protein
MARCLANFRSSSGHGVPIWAVKYRPLVIRYEWPGVANVH